MGKRSRILSDAFRCLAAANQRVGMAILYRDFAAAGEVERAMLVREHIDALAPVSELRPAVVELTERFPAFRRFGTLLALASEASVR